MKTKTAETLYKIHLADLSHNMWNVEIDPKPYDYYDNTHEGQNDVKNIPPHIAVFEETEIEGKETCDFAITSDALGIVYIWLL